MINNPWKCGSLLANIGHFVYILEIQKYMFSAHYLHIGSSFVRCDIYWPYISSPANSTHRPEGRYRPHPPNCFLPLSLFPSLISPPFALSSCTLTPSFIHFIASFQICVAAVFHVNDRHEGFWWGGASAIPWHTSQVHACSLQSPLSSHFSYLDVLLLFRRSPLPRPPGAPQQGM
jgi:hypothetical protein